MISRIGDGTAQSSYKINLLLVDYLKAKQMMHISKSVNRGHPNESVNFHQKGTSN